MNLVNIGFGNLVNADRVVSIVSRNPLLLKRIVQEAKSKRQSYRCNAWKKDHECYYNGFR